MIGLASPKIALVVLGMHRSGTSAMTRVLGLSGFTLPHNLMPPQPDNPTGFWESSTLSQINEEVIDHLGSRWDDVFGADEGALQGDVRERFEQAAVAALQAEFDGASRIVIKDPRACLLTDFWKGALCRAGYAANFVITVRNPLEVASSLAVRDGFIRDKALLLWMGHMLSAERKTRAEPRAIVMFDDLLSRPSGVLGRLDQSLPGAMLPRSASAMVAIDRFIAAGLRHHSDAGGFSSDPLDRMVSVVYDVLRAAARGGALDAGRLDEISAEMTSHAEILGVVHADLVRHANEVGRLYVDLSHRHQELERKESAQATDIERRSALLAAEAAEREDVGQRRRADHDAVTQENARLRRGEEQAIAEIAALKAVGAEAEQAVASARADLQREQERANNAMDAMDAAAAQTADLRRRIETAEAAHADHAREQGRLLRAAEAAAAEAGAEVQRLTLERRLLEEGGRATRSMLDQRAEEVQVLLERVSAMAEALGRSGAREAAFASRIADGEDALARADANHETARSANADVSAQVQVLSVALAQAERDLAYIRTRWWWRVLSRLKRTVVGAGVRSEPAL